MVPGEKTVAAGSVTPVVQSVFSASVTRPLSAPNLKFAEVNDISSPPLTETVKGTQCPLNAYDTP